MPTLSTDPTFVAFAISALLLSANLLALWAYSGVVRAKTRSVMNPEDVTAFGSTAALVTADPPEVARVLRAHSNAVAVVVPFVVAGLVYVLLAGPVLPAKLAFGAFVTARLAHSAAYLREKQPWRTASFAAGLLALVALLGLDVWLLAR